MLFAARPRRLILPRPHGPARRWARGVHVPVPHAVRVVDIVRETAQALTVVLEPESGRPLPFLAGQYLTHLFPIGGEIVRRAYSLSSPEGGRLAFTAKAIAGGLASRYLQQDLRVGDRYQVLGPSGEFLLDAAEDELPLLFVAGGSGITPVVSLIETALARRPQRRIQLIYASHDHDQIIFGARLAALAQAHPGFSLTHALSAREGRLDAARIGALAELAPAPVAYLCGPAGLMDAAQSALLAAQLPAARIRRERFLAAPRAAQARPTEPQPIEFRRAHRTVTQAPGESILEAGLRAGLSLPFSCTVGGCGSCKLQVLDGPFALSEPNCLTPEERAAGATLACSSFALGPLVLDA